MNLSQNADSMAAEKPARWSSHNLVKARRLRRDLTEGEKILWSHLRRDQMGFRVRRQVPFGPYVVDFYVPAAKVAIELDGDLHDPVRDARRDALLREWGVATLRLRSWEMFSDDYTVAASLEQVDHFVRSRLPGASDDPASPS